MPKMIDRTGRKFGRLTVIKFHVAVLGVHYWMCECTCGNLCVVRSSNLVSGGTKSCGCLLENSRPKKHMESSSRTTKEYRAWLSMKRRCCNKDDKHYHNYGGRGISICKEWMGSYQAFLEDIGRAPSKSHSIDRIDVNGDYVPNNCRWATKPEQNRNKRSSIRFTKNGVTKTVKEWCSERSLPYPTVWARINRYNKSISQALEFD